MQNPMSSTDQIAQEITRAIVDRRLPPGAKLAEQALADGFGVSRTLVRQALIQLAQQRLVTLSPARGAFVASPSAEEARQVFAVRGVLEAELVRGFARTATPAQIQVLREHVQQERAAVASGDVPGRSGLLGDFHVRLAEVAGNDVLAQVLRDLIARCAIATLVHQSGSAAHHSADEHARLLDCLAEGDAARAVRLMRQHLKHVEAGLNLPVHGP